MSFPRRAPGRCERSEESQITYRFCPEILRRRFAAPQNDMYMLWQRSLISGDDLVPDLVRLLRDSLEFGMGFEPGKRAT